MSSLKGWKLYNHAIVPLIPPHEEPDLEAVFDGSIWKRGGGPPIGSVDNRI